MGYSPWDHKRVRHDLATKQKLRALSRSKFLIFDDFQLISYPLYGAFFSSHQRTPGLALGLGFFPS